MLCLYQCVTFLLILGLLCFTVLAVKLVQVGGNKGGSGEVSGLQIIV